MFASRALLVVFKTTGGKRWNPREGLKKLTPTQQKTRKENTEQTLKNMSILKMAAAHEPNVPTRLYKPLTLWKINWMRRKLEQAKEVLGWDAPNPQANNILAAKRPGSKVLQAAPNTPAVSFAARVNDLAAKLETAKVQRATSAREQLSS